MINIKDLKRSTVDYGQYLAYRKIYNTVIDISKAGTINVQFGISSTLFIGFVVVNTPVGNVKFYIVKADTFSYYVLQIWTY